MTVDKVSAFQGILAGNPDDAFARYALAMELRQRGETALALEQFDVLQQRHPDYIAGYQMAAQVLLTDGNFQAAEQRLQAGIAVARRLGNRQALTEMEEMLDALR